MLGRTQIERFLIVFDCHVFLSLPVDVVWCSFVTHSFLPLSAPWGRNECVTNDPQRTSAGRLRFSGPKKILEHGC